MCRSFFSYFLAWKTIFPLASDFKTSIAFSFIGPIVDRDLARILATAVPGRVVGIPDQEIGLRDLVLRLVRGPYLGPEVIKIVDLHLVHETIPVRIVITNLLDVIDQLQRGSREVVLQLRK